MVWFIMAPVLFSQKYCSEEPPTALKLLKKSDRMMANRGRLEKISLMDWRTEVSFISSRLMSGTRSRILKNPNTENPAQRINIQ